jgi:hypothetical protein
MHAPLFFVVVQISQSRRDQFRIQVLGELLHLALRKTEDETVPI